MEARVPPDVAGVLQTFGWFPERFVDPAPWTRSFEERGISAPQEVRHFLAQFGGLDIAISGPGVNCAREPFALDPLLCLGEEERFSGWGEKLGVQLFPIGELDAGRFFLGMDEQGVMYLVADWISCFGPWPEAIASLIRGVAPEELPT
jgi:hypothetical protein